jgi:prevent-host-death family protein
MKKASASVGSFHAKTHFSSLLERAANGEVIEITRRGVPVAQLVPILREASKTRKNAIEQMLSFNKGRKLGRLSIKQLIETGRRF